MGKIQLLESRMFSKERWHEVPTEARQRAEEGALQPKPTPRGVAQHPHTGRWYVLEDDPDEGPTVVWREEAECEVCNDDVDDAMFAKARVVGGTPIVSAYVPHLCSDCNEFEQEVH